MSRDDNEFEIVMGRIGHRGRGGSVIAQVLRARSQAGAGRGEVRGTGGRSRFGRGRTAFSRSRLFGGSRRVVVKARVVRHFGRTFRSAPLTAHVAYLERDGVTRDGGKGCMFGPTGDRVDAAAFARRWEDDRHHFRFIVTPEDAADMGDLRAFTRDLAAGMESDLGTRLEWAAIAHWNTDNPHVHLLVRGVAGDGGDLVISRDYIAHGLRSRAGDLVAAELGPKPEHEIRAALEREVEAERWTGLDAAIRMAAGETGLIDLRPDHAGEGHPDADDPQARRLATARLAKLERLGLAAASGPGQWVVSPQAEPVLRDLGLRGDIIKTMHRAFAARGYERAAADYVVDEGAAPGTIVGRLVATGLHDELSGEAFAVIDGTDGRAHHVRFRGVEALEGAPPRGGIVEVRRFGGAGDPRPTLVLATRSDFDLDRQVTAPGATFLDHRLVERQAMPLAMSGFGQEVREAMEARARHLKAQGLARYEGSAVVPQQGLLGRLRGRELAAAGAALAAETGMPYVPATGGETVAGTYQRRLTLTSGRFAMIDNGLGFTLVPWTEGLERHRGRHVAGVARESGGIEWSFGRKRGLEI